DQGLDLRDPRDARRAAGQAVLQRAPGPRDRGGHGRRLLPVHDPGRDALGGRPGRRARRSERRAALPEGRRRRRRLRDLAVARRRDGHRAARPAVRPDLRLPRRRRADAPRLGRL
ncbi:MAG: hypothetical protein AVDCRST_MAG49-2571, partial [uncultured Thermomicrobiales bacterium]